MWLTRRRIVTLGVSAAMFALLLAAATVLALSSPSQNERVARAMTGGDPGRAPAHFRRFGCSGCHTIPGVAGADGQVGGSLTDLRNRVYIGGVATNSPDNLTRWIVSPQAFSPNTAMPATGISDSQARDVAAWLYAR